MDSEGAEEYFHLKKDLLECPVCFETIDSVPIYQCRNGHVVCKNCHTKLETCPICRELRDGSIRNLKLEEMVEKLQLSMSEATKKLSSENIQIDPIVPETQNVNRDAYQETRQDTVQLNIIEHDENVTSEPCCSRFIRIFFKIITFLGIFLGTGGTFFGIGYLFYVGLGLISVIICFNLLCFCCLLGSDI